MEHGGHTDVCAEMLWVCRYCDERLGRRLEQEIVDDGLVGIGDVADRARQREHDVEVRDGKKLGPTVRHPLARGSTLTLRAMPVTATVVGNGRVRAVLATHDVPAERRRAAVLDRAHHLQLAEAHVAAVGLTPCGPVVTEDVRDLQHGTGHRSRRRLVRLLRHQWREPVERAHHLTDDVAGHNCCASTANDRCRRALAQQMGLNFNGLRG